MKSVLLGHDRNSGQKVRIPDLAFGTHLHLIGGTGKGKTTALHTILQPLMLDEFNRPAFFIVDRLGNFCHELLLWMASEFCSEDVRQRLVYIEPANEQFVVGFNPLIYDTEAHGYFKVARATDVILRAWESVNIEAMPRLARWTFNAFWAAAQLGLTIADCHHFLMPGSPYHEGLLNALPDRLRSEWNELVGSRSSEVVRILESSRNRLKPYFESAILRNIFGTNRNTLDVHRFMKEGRIVLLNLAPRDRLSEQLSNSIGAMVLNEVLSVARGLTERTRYPTYLVLDEFQNFVGPDIESALPEVRQLGLRLLLSHQAFSQLERGDYDLTSMIFQAQSRLVFGVQGPDAEILAQEMASLTYDPRRIKDEILSRRQLVTGHRITELSSTSQANALAEQWRKDFGANWTAGNSRARPFAASLDQTVYGRSEGHGTSTREGEGRSTTSTNSTGTHQTLVPTYDEFQEVTSRNFYTFEEQQHLWAQKVRTLRTGQGILRLVDDPNLYELDVKRSNHGYLHWDPAILLERLPQLFQRRDELIAQNFESDIFLNPKSVEEETHKRLQAVISPHLKLGQVGLGQPPEQESSEGVILADPFR